MKPKILLAVLILLTTTGQLLLAQTKGIVVDKVSRQPIAYVSIYTKTGDKVFGAVTNEKGEFSIDFSFQTLFFSHINYEKTEILKSDIKDSIYLIPTTTLLSEVVVSSKQPKWINSLLKQVVEQKNKNYTYKCAVCGRTDRDYPELEFRYCSQCAGYHCFCQDHINNHVHFTE